VATELRPPDRGLLQVTSRSPVRVVHVGAVHAGELEVPVEVRQ
jgi:hypothetical protein